MRARSITSVVVPARARPASAHLQRALVTGPALDRNACRKSFAVPHIGKGLPQFPLGPAGLTIGSSRPCAPAPHLPAPCWFGQRERPVGLRCARAPGRPAASGPGHRRQLARGIPEPQRLLPVRLRYAPPCGRAPARSLLHFEPSVHCRFYSSPWRTCRQPKRGAFSAQLLRRRCQRRGRRWRRGASTGGAR